MTDARTSTETAKPMHYWVGRGTLCSLDNNVHITEAHYPAGWLVAKYDSEGFTTAPRWFPTVEKAKVYAASLA